MELKNEKSNRIVINLILLSIAYLVTTIILNFI